MEADAEADTLFRYQIALREVCPICTMHPLIHIPSLMTLIQEWAAWLVSVPALPHSFMRGYLRRSTRPDLNARRQQQAAAAAAAAAVAANHVTARRPLRDDDHAPPSTRNHASEQLRDISPSPVYRPTTPRSNGGWEEIERVDPPRDIIHEQIPYIPRPFVRIVKDEDHP